MRKVLYINGVIFGLASLGAALSFNIHWLLFFRTIQGITMATIPVAAALVTHNFSEKQQAKAIGVFSAIFGIGLALGPVVGGVITDTIGWRWIFLVNIPIVANEIINGKRGVSADSALAFADTFNMEPKFWLNLQRDWDLWQAQKYHHKIAPLD